MAVKYRDYYESLGVSRTASAEEIQRAYRKLARQYHPDVNKEKAAEARFKEVGEAYEVLKDPEKRAKYDRLGENWKSGEEFRPPAGWEEAMRGGRGRTTAGQGFDFSSAGGGSFSDFFESIFGGSMPGGGGGGFRGGARGRGGKGADARSELEVSLADAYHGATRRITVTDGYGGERTLDVRIPAGTTNGTTIRLAGQASSDDGDDAGDLLLTIKVAPDPRFTLDGYDLKTTVNVAPWEAVLGGKIPVPTLDGDVTMTLPPGTSSGRRLRLKGKGLPQRGGARGDLYAEIVIVIPKDVDEETKAALNAWKERSGFDPRAM